MPLGAVPVYTCLLADRVSSPACLYLRSPGMQNDRVRSTMDRYSMGDARNRHVHSNLSRAYSGNK